MAWPVIQNIMVKSDMGFWARNPKTKRRNQIEDTRLPDRINDSLNAPKFLSEKARAAQSTRDMNAKTLETMETLTDMHLDDVTRKDVPAMYGNVEIKYSKFGVDDFDFAYYNQTQFSGLETHIANSYANPLLQICRFTPWIRNLALQHAASSCLYETCLLCELGFLIDMLEKASGLNCQASNFLKTFSGLSNVASLGLLELGRRGQDLLHELVTRRTGLVPEHTRDRTDGRPVAAPHLLERVADLADGGRGHTGQDCWQGPLRIRLLGPSGFRDEAC